MTTAWKPGDPVYGRFYNQETGLYFAKGYARVIKVEGDSLTIRMRDRVDQVHASVVYHSREECEADIAKKPSPLTSTEPMAHYTAPPAKR